MGEGFIPARFLRDGDSEYRIRDAQLESMGKRMGEYRRLKHFELETLVRNDNTCSDWNTFLVQDPFTPELLQNNSFSGLVRIGKLERVSLEHHDLQLQAGITNSRIIACDIGDNCVIGNCAYIAHYVIGDNCILIDNAEIHVSNHAKFGNGVIVEGEDESVRIQIDVMNESGGRAIRPFEGMECADAYLWARHREDARLMRAFESMTDAMFDTRRGRYGSIGSCSVLKSNGVVKDVAIGQSAYIKGANKLKNLTIRSREDARTQIGEGVELVNGIIGYGCKIFYGCKAVRFVMCDNSSLKYGARLIHSVLGENSTVSCCEILNNLIFPAHEQHHNTSFLIASLVKGQSNLAAGATIGSNHNSRSPDGEIEAGRGFWPGLCTSVKHSSRFASFVLLAKGDYRFELDIPYPFSLVDNDYENDGLVVVPAYWWTSNMYALMRNEAKFAARDNRIDKSIRLEFSPFAPDTAEEIAAAAALLEAETGAACLRYLSAGGDPAPLGVLTSRAAALAAEAGPAASAHEIADLGRAILKSMEDPLPFEVTASQAENSSRICRIRKPARAWNAYRDMLLWYAGREILGAMESMPNPDFNLLHSALAEKDPCPVGVPWENLGGLLAPLPKVSEALSKASSGHFPTWREFHAVYLDFSASYPDWKASHAWFTLANLYRDEHGSGFGKRDLLRALHDLAALSERVERAVLESRRKDWINRFRKATYRSEAEMVAVLGLPEDNSSVRKNAEEMAALRAKIGTLTEAFA